MTKNKIQIILESSYCKELIPALMKSYVNALMEYRKSHWQYAGAELAQFVEISRRIIQQKVFGIFTPLKERLTTFNERELASFEKASANDSLRIIIPRCLYFMYCIRNKRGIVHKGDIDPNKLDSTVLLNAAKWVLAEFIRLAGSIPFEEANELMDSIMSKEIDIVWNTGQTLRILDNKISTTNKILCLLYVKNNQTDRELQQSIEYANFTRFKILLKKLHKARKIEYNKSFCQISTLGILEAEKILIQQNNSLL